MNSGAFPEGFERSETLGDRGRETAAKTDDKDEKTMKKVLK